MDKHLLTISYGLTIIRSYLQKRIALMIIPKVFIGLLPYFTCRLILHERIAGEARYAQSAYKK